MSNEPGSPDDFAKAMEGRSYERKKQPEAGGDIARVLGVVLLGIGIFALYSAVLDPLRAAAAGAAAIEFRFKFVAITPFALGAGALLLLFGGRVAEMLDSDSKSKLSWVAGALILAGLGLAIWMRWHFSALGYSF